MMEGARVPDGTGRNCRRAALAVAALAGLWLAVGLVAMARYTVAQAAGPGLAVGIALALVLSWAFCGPVAAGDDRPAGDPAGERRE